MKSFDYRFFIAFVLVSSALIPENGALAASCFTGSQVVDPAKTSADEAAIKADPGKWLVGQGGGLASAVRNLAASDPDFASTLVSQAKSASPEQAAAVGAGLGQAAGACQALPPEAAKIQAAAATATDANLVASFSSTTGSTQTAATGGGAAGGGGGGDAGGGTGVGGASGLTTPTTGGGGGTAGVAAPATTGTANTFTNLLTGGTAASSSALTRPTTATTTVSSSVSSF